MDYDKYPPFPNPFNLDDTDLEKVYKLMDQFGKNGPSYSAAELVTAHLASILAVFALLRTERNASTSDMLFVVRNIKENMVNFIHALPLPSPSSPSSPSL